MSGVFAFLGAQEVVVILGIALLVFGPTRLPEIGRQIALALREMRKMSNDVQRALDLNEYDTRYDGGSYNNGASSWTSSGPGGNENDGEPPANTRPWSLTDGEDEVDWGDPAVTTVEPPGPPVLRERQPSSEASQA